MFKLPGKSAPVIPPQPQLTGPDGPAAVSTATRPPPLTLAALPPREGGDECLPMEAWHEDALPRPVPESRRLITRMAASIRALVRPPREEAPVTQAIPSATHPRENRLGRQPPAIVATVASFLSNRDLHSVAQVAHQFESIPASNPRFVATAPLARELEQLELRAADMTNESERLKTKLDLLNDLGSRDSSRVMRANRMLDPDDSRSDRPSIRARIREIDAEMPELRMKRYEILRDMKTIGATQPAPETKAATENSSSSTSSSTSSSSSSQDMPMPPDQWEARQRQQ